MRVATWINHCRRKSIRIPYLQQNLNNLYLLSKLHLLSTSRSKLDLTTLSNLEYHISATFKPKIAISSWNCWPARIKTQFLLQATVCRIGERCRKKACSYLQLNAVTIHLPLASLANRRRNQTRETQDTKIHDSFSVYWSFFLRCQHSAHVQNH